MAAMQNERDRLRELGAWDASAVREWSGVKREANEKGVAVHACRIFGFCVEKNSELAEDNPSRNVKYRSVFEGSNVRTQSAEEAVFAELSSSPASVEASRLGDFYGCWPKHSCQAADAIQAPRLGFVCPATQLFRCF